MALALGPTSIGHPDIAFGVDVNAMRPINPTRTEALDQLPRPVEFQN